MKFIPSKLIDIIAEKYESSENIIDQKGEIYCKTLTDYDSKIYFKNGIKYFGSIENGILNGRGTIVMPNGLKFTGNFINNQIEGKGLLEYSDHEYYNGEIKNLQRNGQGVYENKIAGIIYEGQWKDDQFEGKGKLTVKDQWEYEGTFQNGIKHGQGIVRYTQSGNVFDGNFINNQKNGYGEMKWLQQKQIYKGNWLDNKLTGFGVYIYKSELQGKKNLRNYYIGEFANNNREGFGIHFYSDSSAYIGLWKNGQKDGKAIFIDNNGFQNLKQFKNNHLMETQYIQDFGFSDFQIPRVEFIGTQNENWNHEILEKVVKTLNPNLRQIFEANTNNEQIFFDVIKSYSLQKFQSLLKKIRFYDTFISQTMVKQIIQKYSSCFCNMFIDQNDFKNLKQNYLQFIEGKCKNFQLNQKFNKYSTMNYLQFINALFILLQYKYRNSDNIERDIRSFIVMRLLGILKNKIKVKEWIKDEVSITLKYEKIILKNQSYLKNIFQRLQSKEKNFTNKSLFQFLVNQKNFDFNSKKDLYIFLKVTERYNDPLTSCFDKLRKTDDLQQCYLSYQFVSLLNQEIKYKQFEQNLILILHYKLLQNHDADQESMAQWLENLQIKNQITKKFPQRQFSHLKDEQISENQIQQTEQNSEQTVISNKELNTEQSLKQEFIEIQETVKQESIKEIAKNQIQKNIDIDSFSDGYFIKLESFKKDQTIN